MTDKETKDIEKRRDASLARALSTPHKPHVAKKAKKKAAKKAAKKG